MAALTLTVGAIVVHSDGTTGEYQLTSWDPGPSQRDNTYGTSERVDGGDLTNSRKPIVNAQLRVLVSGTDIDDAFVNATALADALDGGGDEFTLTEAFGATTSNAFTCFPATVSILRDPDVMEHEVTFEVVATIPRMP